MSSGDSTHRNGSISVYFALDSPKEMGYAALTPQRASSNAGLRREDVFINLVEVAKENWSFGNGEAQYAT
jgi:tautomerase-like protein